jgi:hypothetical protein
MRYLVGVYLTDGVRQPLVDMAVGEATAAQLSHSFFALCRDAADFSDAELEIESHLRREVEEDIIPTRNSLMHGDWMVGALRLTTSGISGEVVPPRLTRILPHQKAGPYAVRQITVEQLDAMADRLLDVLGMVVEFGKLSLGLSVVKAMPEGNSAVSKGEFRVQDVFAVPDSTKRRDRTTPPKAAVTPSKRAKVTRSGPRADEVGLLPYVA